MLDCELTSSKQNTYCEHGPTELKGHVVKSRNSLSQLGTEPSPLCLQDKESFLSITAVG